MQYNLALRSRAIRAGAPAIRRIYAPAHARALNTVGPRAAPDPNRPTTEQVNSAGPHHKKGPDRNALYIGGGLAAIGAVWYYYSTMADGRTVDVQIQKAGVEDASRSAKGRAQEAMRSGDAKYQDIKAEAQSKVQAARDQVGQGVERGKQRFEEVKDQAAHRASEDRAAVERKVDEAKSSGRGWLSWGKSQTRDAADDLKRRADETQEAWKARFEEAKREAAEKGEEMKQRLDETEDEFRNRVAKAIEKR